MSDTFSHSYSTVGELQDSLGNGDMAVGIRSLERKNTDGSIYDYPMVDSKLLRGLDTDGVHAQLFGKDANGTFFNIGYSKHGVVSDPNFPGNIKSYHFGPIQHVAINQNLLHPSQYTIANYSIGIFHHQECQDYIHYESRIQHFDAGGF
jgi:hypothetical protein